MTTRGGSAESPVPPPTCPKRGEVVKHRNEHYVPADRMFAHGFWECQ